MQASSFSQLIKVYDLPDVDIFFSQNVSTRAEDEKYDYKSLIVDQDGDVLIMFSSVNRFDGYYQLKFMIDEVESEFYISEDSIIATRSLSSLGRDTMACWVDAFGNHGWASLWITLQSCFLPQTAVAIAAACAVKNMVY